MKNPKKILKVLVINGPNLNMLGKREPEIYGFQTLEDINADLIKLGKKIGLEVETYQSNHEGDIIEKIQNAKDIFSGLIINPAALTHSSIGIRDAILLLKMPVIEVHLSNVHKRETFRQKSMIADIVDARLMGFGPFGYLLALEAMNKMLCI
jgi:3-dehydroquinate dehydratase-2